MAGPTPMAREDPSPASLVKSAGQRGEVAAEPLREARHGEEGGVPLPALDLAHESPVESGAVAERLHGDAQVLATRADALPELGLDGGLRHAGKLGRQRRSVQRRLVSFGLVQGRRVVDKVAW